jgi:putative hydrolase of the HAD superfamily
MIKRIIFDFGNVICRFTNDLFIERISNLTLKSKEEVFDLIYKKSDITKIFESGLITSEEFYKELSNICGLNVSYDELKDIYTKNKFTPILGMNELIESLKHNYKIGLLSNTGPWDYDYLQTVAPIINTFDSITTSFEVGVMKPDKKIFEDALSKSPLNPEECLYIDDIIEYVNAAKKIGMKAIQFMTLEKFKIDLKSFGIKF